MTALPHAALGGMGTTTIWLACGATHMRKGFDGLAVLVQQVLAQAPHSGALFAFRGKALPSACLGRQSRGAAIW